MGVINNETKIDANAGAGAVFNTASNEEKHKKTLLTFANSIRTLLVGVPLSTFKEHEYRELEHYLIELENKYDNIGTREAFFTRYLTFIISLLGEIPISEIFANMQKCEEADEKSESEFLKDEVNAKGRHTVYKLFVIFSMLKDNSNITHLKRVLCKYLYDGILLNEFPKDLVIDDNNKSPRLVPLSVLSDIVNGDTDGVDMRYRMYLRPEADIDIAEKTKSMVDELKSDTCVAVERVTNNVKESIESTKESVEELIKHKKVSEKENSLIDVIDSGVVKAIGLLAIGLGVIYGGIKIYEKINDTDVVILDREDVISGGVDFVSSSGEFV